MEEKSKSLEELYTMQRPISKKHKPMSLENRAAQFSPFAALTGYEAAIEETARITDDKVDQTEDALLELDEKLFLIEERLKEGRVDLRLVYFQPDLRKDGGSYLSYEGSLKRIDSVEKSLIFVDGRKMFMKDISELELL